MNKREKTEKIPQARDGRKQGVPAGKGGDGCGGGAEKRMWAAAPAPGRKTEKTEDVRAENRQKVKTGAEGDKKNELRKDLTCKIQQESLK